MRRALLLWIALSLFSCVPQGLFVDYDLLDFEHPITLIRADSAGFSLLRDPTTNDTLLVWSQHCAEAFCFIPSVADRADLIASCHPQVLPDRYRLRHVFPDHVGSVCVVRPHPWSRRVRFVAGACPL